MDQAVEHCCTDIRRVHCYIMSLSLVSANQAGPEESLMSLVIAKVSRWADAYQAEPESESSLNLRSNLEVIKSNPRPLAHSELSG